MDKVFLIAGMGADVRLFKNLDLSGFEVIDAAWIEPDYNDTITSYAKKLIAKYNITAQGNVIGVSLGGMLAVEIAKQVDLKNVIIISSIKSISEAPSYYQIFKVLPVYKLITGKLVLSMGKLLKPFFSKKMGGESHLFDSMLRNTSPVFLKWSMGAALHWDGQMPSQHIHHLIGDADMIFDYRKIKDAIVIPGGDHMMVFTRAKELNPIIRNILSQ
jgi:pimeloyl-ACP methyl ester carboxylesterase